MSKQQDLKSAVEAASKGKQTVLFTPSGQPTFVNVINRADVSTSDDLLLTGLGVSGDHPAFKIKGTTKDKIYVSTYPSQLVNGELLSLPFVAGTGIKSVTLNTSGIATYLAATGLNAHVATVAELNLLKSIVRKTNFNPYGNDNMRGRSEVDTSQFGVRVDGLAVGSNNTTTTTAIGAQLSGSLKTGSGTTGFRLGNSPVGVSDLGYYFSHPVYGVRIIKGEVQVYNDQTLNNPADNLNPIMNLSVIGDSLKSNFNTGWYAIDATTGNFITPTYTGDLLISEGTGLDTKNYVVTTPNSVKLTQNSTSSGGYYSVGNLAFDGSLPTKVVNILKYLGLITDNNPQVSPNPAKRGAFSVAANGLNIVTWGSSGIFEPKIELTTATSNLRICYYD